MNVMTKQGSLDNNVTYEHYCDTTADLKNIPKDQITLGSVAIILKNESNELEVYMANSNKEWIPLLNSGSDSGNGSTSSNLSVHICNSNEYSNGVPTIANPSENTFYFVPAVQSSGNLYDKWIYINGDWERFDNGNNNATGADTNGSGDKVMIVNFTWEEEQGDNGYYTRTYSADKTYAEILEHFENGGVVIGRAPYPSATSGDSVGMMLPSSMIRSTGHAFYGIYLNPYSGMQGTMTAIWYEIREDDTVLSNSRAI